MIGHNLLVQGDITGWDGRNLVGGTDARTLNEQLRDPLPPLMLEVVSPPRTAHKLIYSQLRELARQDDTVVSSTFYYTDILAAELGDKLLICCHHDSSSSEHAKKVASQIGENRLLIATKPDWAVVWHDNFPAQLDRGDYEAVLSTNQIAVTIRPELNLHVWLTEPILVPYVSHLLRKRDYQ